LPHRIAAGRGRTGGRASPVRNFDLKVTPKRGELTLAIWLGKPDPGEKPDALLEVDGSDLNQEHPKFDIRL
jgi:hypothetical protein